MLRVEELRLSYGMRPILRSISFYVESGEIVSLVGGNAAGKTSTLRAIVGLSRPSGGQICFNQQNIIGLGPEQSLGLGIAFCAAERQLFPDMTVRENLEMGAYIFGKGSERALEDSIDRVYGLFPFLERRIAQRAGTLSGGEQKMVAIARALISKPKLLLLDEPSLGLAPNMVERFAHTILEMQEQGLTLLIAEQNRSLAFALSGRVYQLERGQFVSPEEVEYS